MLIETIPSPNFTERRDGALPDMLVLHYTAMQSAQAACKRLCDPDAEVSAHYLIAEDGQVTQMVDETMRAWHAGAGQWGDVTDVNSRSIGIELANRGDHPFSNPQMNALEALMDLIMQRWHIPPERVIGHSDMAPLRKPDPGPRFDWRRLALGGRAVWPTPAQPRDFDRAAQAFGYACEDTQAVLRAFRDRFRPWATGPMDDMDRALITDLSDRFGVDRSPTSA